jgi:hypothetical protein
VSHGFVYPGIGLVQLLSDGLDFYCFNVRRYWSIIDREMARSDEPGPRTQVNSSIVAAFAGRLHRTPLPERPQVFVALESGNR